MIAYKLWERFFENKTNLGLLLRDHRGWQDRSGVAFIAKITITREQHTEQPQMQERYQNERTTDRNKYRTKLSHFCNAHAKIYISVESILF